MSISSICAISGRIQQSTLIDWTSYVVNSKGPIDQAKVLIFLETHNNKENRQFNEKLIEQISCLQDEVYVEEWENLSQLEMQGTRPEFFERNFTQINGWLSCSLRKLYEKKIEPLNKCKTVCVAIRQKIQTLSENDDRKDKLCKKKTEIQELYFAIANQINRDLFPITQNVLGAFIDKWLMENQQSDRRLLMTIGSSHSNEQLFAILASTNFVIIDYFKK